MSRERTRGRGLTGDDGAVRESTAADVVDGADRVVRSSVQMTVQPQLNGGSMVTTVTTKELSDLVVYDATDLRRVLGIGRPNAYRLLRQLGRRVGRRLVVARAVLERWLGDGGASVPLQRRTRKRRIRATEQ